MDFSDFIADLSLRELSAQTVKAYQSDLEFFGNYLDNRGLKLRQVTPTVVGEFRAHMKTLQGRKSPNGLAPATVDRRMAALARFFKHLCFLNPRRKNPVEVFSLSLSRRHRLQEHIGKAVDDRSVQILLEGIDNARDGAMFSLFLASGLRLSELAQLNIDSLTEESELTRDGTEHVFGTGTVIGKGNKERRFYFDLDAIGAIAKYLATRKDNHPALFISERGTRLSTRAIQYTLDIWCKRLGLRHVHIHALRHTFATNLANANMEPLVLQSLMGHSNFETTTRYFRLADDMKARQYYSAMEFVRGPQQ
jgi:site-specific recombinase XerC